MLRSPGGLPRQLEPASHGLSMPSECAKDDGYGDNELSRCEHLGSTQEEQGL